LENNKKKAPKLFVPKLSSPEKKKLLDGKRNTKNCLAFRNRHNAEEKENQTSYLAFVISNLSFKIALITKL